MKTVIFYESIYGNTFQVANEMAKILRRVGEVTLVATERANADSAQGANLVIVGGPSTVHDVARSPRRPAPLEARGTGPTLTLERDAESPGISDWFDVVEHVRGVAAAAFDTRLDISQASTERASTLISRRLCDNGFFEVARPRSFLVDEENRLIAGQLSHATRWVRQILDSVQ